MTSELAGFSRDGSWSTWKIEPGLSVHSYSADASGLLTNAFVLETDVGLIAVDALMRVSDARALRGLCAELRKPLLAVIVTHGHPDHYNGVTELIAGNPVPVLATAGVDAVMRHFDDAKERKWKPAFGSDWPAQRTFASMLVRPGDDLTIGGVTLTVQQVGSAESNCDSYWVVRSQQPVAFIGDLAFQGVHSYVSDGHTFEWLRWLERLRVDLEGVSALFVGHGEPCAGIGLLDTQARYLTAYRNAVTQLGRGKAMLTDPEKSELKRIMNQWLDSDALEDFIVGGADAVARELFGT
jgi:glyoxylase-like metal-dependent hydrolase (beta-lactamase superfamily II)